MVTEVGFEPTPPKRLVIEVSLIISNNHYLPNRPILFANFLEWLLRRQMRGGPGTTFSYEWLIQTYCVNGMHLRSKIENSLSEHILRVH